MEQAVKRVKAPNGKPTNLTVRQRLAVRSAIFNRLFGDWRQEDWEQTDDNENKQEVRND